jgi:hypothetical protein
MRPDARRFGLRKRRKEVPCRNRKRCAGLFYDVERE